VGPGAGLDDVEKRQFLILQGLELRPPGRPARSQSLYRLRDSGSPPPNNMQQNKYKFVYKQLLPSFHGQVVCDPMTRRAMLSGA
jgi:hypothetical protein